MTKLLATSTHARTRQRRVSTPSGERCARVLIGEERWALRDLLVWAFEDQGYEVVAVGTGPDLLHVLSASLSSRAQIEPFDLVVADVALPGWLGLGAVEKLSSNPRVPPVVVLTAFDSGEVHRRATRAGALAVLDKPFAVGALTEIANRLLSRRAERAAVRLS